MRPEPQDDVIGVREMTMQTQAAAAEVPQDVEEAIAHETPEMEEAGNRRQHHPPSAC